MKTISFVGLAIFAAACGSESIDSHSEAQLVSPDLVIAQVYGGGGNGGATYTNDYVVLFNRGTIPTSLDTHRLLYASASSNVFSSSIALSGTIPVGGSYLVQLGSSGSVGAALPNPDLTATLNISATDGNLALVDATNACATDGGTCDDSTFIDLVGYGSGTHVEGTHAKSPSNTTSILRGASGCVDTGDNSADFRTVTLAPRTSAAAAVDCTALDMTEAVDAGEDLEPVEHDLSASVDMTKPDFADVDFGAGGALLNEVKWNPGGSDTGAEFVELIGSGTLPPCTYVLSVDGDSGTAGRVHFVHDLSLTPFGSNGLILVKASATTFPGTAPETTIVNDAALAGSPIQNGTETVLLIQSSTPLTIKVDSSTSSNSTLFTLLSGYSILDSIAATDSTTDTTFGTVMIAPCPTGTGASAVDGASRITGNSMTAASAWYAGQAVGGPLDQLLNDVSACSSGPSTWTMSPGRPNDDPYIPPDDLAEVAPADLALAANDQSATLEDLAGAPADASHVSSTTTPKSGGCSIAGSTSRPSLILLVLFAIPIAMRRRTHLT